MFESSKFIIDICKHFYGIISQYAAQILPPPTTISKTHNIRKLYHRHLHYGIRTDALSGWLLYASFYYVTGQYNVTLKLTEYVLSRCKHDMVEIGYIYKSYEEEKINSYRKNVHSKITLKDRMKLATVDHVNYIRHSSLIPEELKLEMEDNDINITPFVLSYCLRFLCHHHLGDMTNRQEALHNLFLTVKNYHCLCSNEISKSKTILGVFYEISGDITNAYQCYDEALEYGEYVCLSAEVRKSNLLLGLK
ncbi:unnamed protein product [Mytilus coruscus]|uniref:Uncharacterized protein n=1 Tax=Mytilus coruscus TaxID=42192 RepID=A0A6J8B1G1_MYTCO|nr:unnamed protein product [Mytilus coruscus]